MTILHHAASSAIKLGSNRSGLVHQLLFNSAGLDFTVKDSIGDTPVHVAASWCRDKATCFYVLPDFIHVAAGLGFDFSTKGQKGYTVLHLSALVSYEGGWQGRIKNLSNVLKLLVELNIPNLKSVMDTMSDSGATPLFYCINHFLLDEARALLEAGADPQLCGSPDRDPSAQINTFKNDLTDLLAEATAEGNQQKIERLEESYKSLTEFESYFNLCIQKAEKTEST